MKKLFIAVGLFLLSSLFMQANALVVEQKDTGYVSVNAVSAKEIIPDTASIYFSVETSSTDSKAAVNKNKEISSQLIDSLKPILALDKSDSIQTRNFILRPNYSYDKNGKRTFINYTAVNTIYVKTKKLENVPKLIDLAVKNSATTVSDLNFLVENEKQYAGELAQEALSKAKILATLTASALGQKVTGIKSVRVNIYPQNNYAPRGAIYSNAKTAAIGAAKSTPVEYGKIKLQANVDAEFYVK